MRDIALVIIELETEKAEGQRTRATKNQVSKSGDKKLWGTDSYAVRNKWISQGSLLSIRKGRGGALFSRHFHVGLDQVPDEQVLLLRLVQ